MDHVCRYFGLSSTGITYKSSAASFSCGSYPSGSCNGITQSSKEADTSRDSYRGKEWSNSSKETIADFRSTIQMSRGNTSSTTKYYPRKGEGHHKRNQDSSTSHLKSSSNLHSTSGGTSSQKVDNEDYDDFNPQGSSTSAKGGRSFRCRGCWAVEQRIFLRIKAQLFSSSMVHGDEWYTLAFLVLMVEDGDISYVKA